VLWAFDQKGGKGHESREKKNLEDSTYYTRGGPPSLWKKALARGHPLSHQRLFSGRERRREKDPLWRGKEVYSSALEAERISNRGSRQKRRKRAVKRSDYYVEGTKRGKMTLPNQKGKALSQVQRGEREGLGRRVKEKGTQALLGEGGNTRKE